jgi:hypothetical protein
MCIDSGKRTGAYYPLGWWLTTGETVLSKQRTTTKSKELIREQGDRLTEKQRGLVANLMQPGINQEEAAIAAGYAVKNAGPQASRTLRLPHVVAYINAVVSDGIQARSLGALVNIVDIGNTAKSEMVKMQANQDILDRAGHGRQSDTGPAIGELKVHIDLS